MYPYVRKILKLSVNDIDLINQYLEKGAIILSIDTIDSSEHSSTTSYFYIGLTYSSN